MKARKNDSCPCGSGKKYKRCCSLSAPVYPDLSVYNEMPRATEEKSTPDAVAQPVEEVTSNDTGNG